MISGTLYLPNKVSHATTPPHGFSFIDPTLERGGDAGQDRFDYTALFPSSAARIRGIKICIIAVQIYRLTASCPIAPHRFLSGERIRFPLKWSGSENIGIDKLTK